MVNAVVGQTGLPFMLEIVEIDENNVETILDPTGATTKQIEFSGPNNINFRKTATDNLSNGKWFLTYTDPNNSSILTKKGKWKMRHYVVKSNGKISIGNTTKQFEVDA